MNATRTLAETQKKAWKLIHYTEARKIQAAFGVVRL